MTSLFSENIQAWYQREKRLLPWRSTKNPYFIWLSEVILQQTRVQQGLPYYQKFIEAFPKIEKLAGAYEQDVLNLWQGLGYYSRARNMHKTAKHVVQECQGVFPKNYLELLKLPGIGPYSAAAIASFAFNEPRAVVDGNVYRVLSRYFNSSIPINKPEGQKFFQKMADELLDQKNPAAHNQAIMELGALICSPKKPNCASCPLSDSCEAQYKNAWQQLPVKIGKTKVRNRYLNYFVCLTADQILVQQRGDKDIWAKMYEFPLIESESLDSEILREISLIKHVNHKLTHQNLSVHFFKASKSTSERIAPNGFWVLVDDLKTLPLPRVIEKFLDETYKLETK